MPKLFARPTVAREAVVSVADAMQADGRISLSERNALVGKLSGNERSPAYSVLGDARRILSSTQAHKSFREFLSEESGTFIPERREFLYRNWREPADPADYWSVSEKHFGSPYAVEKEFALKLRGNPKSREIAERMKEIAGRYEDEWQQSAMLRNLAGHLALHEPRHFQERLGQIGSFANSSAIRSRFLSHALRLGSLHTVEHFLRMTGANEGNADWLSQALGACGNAIQAREAASFLRGLDLSNDGVMEFVGRSASASSHPDKFEGLRLNVKLLKGYLASRDRVKFLADNAVKIGESFKREKYGDGEIKAAAALLSLDGNASSLFKEEELQPYGWQRTQKDFFEEMGRRASEIAGINKEAAKLPPRLRQDYAELARFAASLPEGMGLNAGRFKAIASLRRMFEKGLEERYAFEFESGMKNSYHRIDQRTLDDFRKANGFDFNKMVALPLLSASPDEENLAHNIEALKTFGNPIERATINLMVV